MKKYSIQRLLSFHLKMLILFNLTYEIYAYCCWVTDNTTFSSDEQKNTKNMNGLETLQPFFFLVIYIHFIRVHQSKKLA
jgi:hypothetical protein